MKTMRIIITIIVSLAVIFCSDTNICTPLVNDRFKMMNIRNNIQNVKAVRKKHIGQGQDWLLVSYHLYIAIG